MNCYTCTLVFVLVVVVVVVVVLTLTRIIKSVVTGQAPVTLEWRRTPGKSMQGCFWFYSGHSQKALDRWFDVRECHNRR